jgi:bacillithiol synthase
MNAAAQHIGYNGTGYFSTLVLDYLANQPALQPFYNQRPTLAGIKAIVEQKKKTAMPRAALVQALQAQYAAATTHAQVRENVEALVHENTFTVTTAHQPNIFTGPLYFIYKILHAIQLASELQQQQPENRFVPVYYMGSEDADLDELGFINLNGEKLRWQTSQTGAVGRMVVDKNLLQLLNRIVSQASFLPNGKDITDLLRRVYKEGVTVEQATFELVNGLFGRFGLVVVLPDNAALKKLFIPVIEKEIFERFSHPLVAQTIGELSKQYKVQAAGRDINLFYLKGNLRNRIVVNESGDGYAVVDTDIVFTPEAMRHEIQQHPERFSPNVILRGLFQEMILPNVAFIGGGGEIAYWLELKRVFDACETPFPALVLRNSFLLMQQAQQQQLNKAGIAASQLFLPIHQLEAQFVKQQSQKRLSLEPEKTALTGYYNQLSVLAGATDPTLIKHTAALHAKALQKIEALETKMLRAEKRNHADRLRQLTTVRNQLFPGSSLQERTENMIPYLAQWGTAFFDQLLAHSPATEGDFVVLTISGT